MNIFPVCDKEMAKFLGLSEIKGNPRGARFGFPVRQINRYFRWLTRRKVSITLILQRDRYWTGIQERTPAYRFEWKGQT